jgi:phage terminase large subunit-like protein
MALEDVLTDNPKRNLAILLQEKARRARRNRLKYYRPYDKQREFHAAGAKYRERLFSAGNQLGKALRNGTPVLTPCGWKPIEQLRIGDRVIAGDGSITTVTGVYPQGVKPVYRLTFDCHEEVVCCGEHLWKYQPPAARYPMRHSHGKVEVNSSYGNWVVGNTEEILAVAGENPKPRRRVLTPVVGTVEFGSKPVTIDPYLLGLLLGDGHIGNDCVGFTTVDPELKQAVIDTVPASCSVRCRGGIDFHIGAEMKRAANGTYTSNNPLLNSMRAYGLAGKNSWEKFVPQDYLLNDSATRLAVLQGLMDTDGSVSKEGVIEYCTTSDQLVRDVLFLLRSFGVKAKARSRITSFTHKGEKKEGRVSWRVYVRSPRFPLFRLERKQSRVQAACNTDHHVIRSIVPTGEAECTCISVAHESRTFVIEHFIVTHNTLAGSFETAMHLTGRYPDWWEGKVFDRPTVGWAASVSGASTRDGVQRLLLGRPGVDSERGTAAIPGDAIKELSPLPGTPNAYSQVVVRHGGGGDVQAGESVLGFRNYEQGRQKFQVETLDFIWLDEEPPHDIYMEALTRTNTTLGPVYLTFTPLMGMSLTVMRFLVNKHPGTVVVFMGIYDAKHYTKEQADSIVGSYPEHEREARAFGKPVLGSGAVFPIPESEIVIPGFAIPDAWHRICGLDLGWDHPTAACWLAHDRESDTVYLYDVYKRNKTVPAIHASAIRARGDWIPVAWPHDALQTQKDTGIPMRDTYMAEGVAMLPERAQFEDGSYGVEPGIQIMLNRMQTGRFKVFASCEGWLEEYRLYHRKDGVIVKQMDDAIDASRAGVMSLRYAGTRSIGQFTPYREDWR